MGHSGDKWIIADSWWAKLVGLMVIQSWKSPMIYLLAVQLSAAAVALVDLHANTFGFVSWRDSCLGHFLLAVEQLGFKFGVDRNLFKCFSCNLLHHALLCQM